MAVVSGMTSVQSPCQIRHLQPISPINALVEALTVRRAHSSPALCRGTRMKLHTMGRTLGAHRRPGLMVVAVVLMALGLGMGWFVVQQHTAALQERGKTAEWYVSQYPAENRRWLPESQLATTHQLRSAMAIYEVTQYPHATEATQAQRRPAEALVQRSRAAAERKGWFRFEKALQDGFELMFEDTVHFANKALIADNRILDPERPDRK